MPRIGVMPVIIGPVTALAVVVLQVNRARELVHTRVQVVTLAPGETAVRAEVMLGAADLAQLVLEPAIFARRELARAPAPVEAAFELLLSKLDAGIPVMVGKGRCRREKERSGKKRAETRSGKRFHEIAFQRYE